MIIVHFFSNNFCVFLLIRNNNKKKCIKGLPNLPKIEVAHDPPKVIRMVCDGKKVKKYCFKIFTSWRDTEARLLRKLPKNRFTTHEVVCSCRRRRVRLDLLSKRGARVWWRYRRSWRQKDIQQYSVFVHVGWLDTRRSSDFRTASRPTVQENGGMFSP